MRNKVLLILTLFFVSAIALTADPAVLTSVKGTVEIKPKGKDWGPARVNMAIPEGAMISTGFGSTAVVSTGRASITVDPLTRVALEDLGKGSGSNTSQSLALKGGSLDVKVQTSSTGAKFNVSSPVVTASVRGTSFTFDGTSLTTTDGIVEMVTPTGVRRVVPAGKGIRVSAPVSASKANKPASSSSSSAPVVEMGEPIIESARKSAPVKERLVVEEAIAELPQEDIANDSQGSGGNTTVPPVVEEIIEDIIPERGSTPSLEIIF